MRYLGGKSKIRKPLAAFLESMRKPGQRYLEPFVGGGWVLQEMSGQRVAADANVALIAMYQALQKGWEPPDYVSEEEYNAGRSLPDTDPLKAFIGFGCSFGGKWMGGYARGDGRDFPAETRRNLLKQLPLIRDVVFLSYPYQEFCPNGWFIYCDPPYAGTTSYGATGEFDHAQFWQTMREWSERNTVLISEYQAPDDFRCVKECQSRMGMTAGGVRGVRVEKVFMWEGAC